MLTQRAPWGHTPRPWGYEVRVDFVDEEMRVHNEVLMFAEAPNAVTLDAAVQARHVALEARLKRESLTMSEATAEDYTVRIAALEMQVAALATERDALIAARDALPIAPRKI